MKKSWKALKYFLIFDQCALQTFLLNNLRMIMFRELVVGSHKNAEGTFFQHPCFFTMSPIYSAMRGISNITAK